MTLTFVDNPDESSEGPGPVPGTARVSEDLPSPRATETEAEKISGDLSVSGAATLTPLAPRCGEGETARGWRWPCGLGDLGGLKAGGVRLDLPGEGEEEEEEEQEDRVNALAPPPPPRPLGAALGDLA